MGRAFPSGATAKDAIDDVADSAKDREFLLSVHTSPKKNTDQPTDQRDGAPDDVFVERRNPELDGPDFGHFFFGFFAHAFIGDLVFGEGVVVVAVAAFDARVFLEVHFGLVGHTGIHEGRQHFRHKDDKKDKPDDYRDNAQER